jgi:hypothetical protein
MLLEKHKRLFPDWNSKKKISPQNNNSMKSSFEFLLNSAPKVMNSDEQF